MPEAQTPVVVQPDRAVVQHPVDGLPLLMGVLNITPDSFSDGGLWVDPQRALAHAHALVAQGADLIDVGGESTRPGSVRVDPQTEQDRILPVVEALISDGVAVSVDTMNASTAAITARLGARYINDVSGGLADPDLFDAVAETDAALIVSHWRGLLSPGRPTDQYVDVTAETLAEVEARLDAARTAGIGDERLIVDPGLGFSKDSDHNWQLLADIGQFVRLGLPVLVGASRKRFIADAVPVALKQGDRADAAEALRAKDAATAALAALLLDHGLWGWRVHDVGSTRAALKVARQLRGHHGRA